MLTTKVLAKNEYLYFVFVQDLHCDTALLFNQLKVKKNQHLKTNNNNNNRKTNNKSTFIICLTFFLHFLSSLRG